MSIVLKQAAQQAIEAIQDLRGYRPDIDKAIEALRAALSQQPATRLPEDVVIGHVTLCKGSNISLLIEYAKRLNADVERLEAQQPATGEPVGYMNEGHIHELAMRRLPYGYVYPEAGAGASTAVYPRPAPSVPDDVVRDAERYRWLREQHWHSSELCCVSKPKSNVRLGGFCPSGDLLDEAIDAAMLHNP